GSLKCDENSCRCTRCSADYPIKDGVYCFVGPDKFYEERYAATTIRFVPNANSPLDMVLLYLFSQHYFWYIHKFFRGRGAILDVACGAGARYLAAKGSVAGLDLSFKSVQRSVNTYDC